MGPSVVTGSVTMGMLVGKVDLEPTCLPGSALCRNCHPAYGRAEPWHDKLHSPGSPRAGACQLVGETRFWAGWLCDQGSPGLALGWKWLGPRSADCRACSVLRLMLAHWWAGKPLSQKERTPDWSILFICFETVMLMQSQSWDDYRVMPHCFPMSWEQQCERGRSVVQS